MPASPVASLLLLRRSVRAPFDKIGKNMFVRLLFGFFVVIAVFGNAMQFTGCFVHVGEGVFKFSVCHSVFSLYLATVVFP
jgi:hypothetical protein